MGYRRQAKRAELAERRQRRVERRRFRQDPPASLRQLEDQLNQSGLPAEKKRTAGE